LRDWGACSLAEAAEEEIGKEDDGGRNRSSHELGA
jgi:hypothetical protein